MVEREEEARQAAPSALEPPEDWAALVVEVARWEAVVVEVMPGCQTPPVLSRMFPWVARVAVQAEPAKQAAPLVMPGCQTPLALSRMFPWVARAEVQEALLVPVAPLVARPAGPRELAGLRVLAGPRVPEAGLPTPAVQATPAGA